MAEASQRTNTRSWLTAQAQAWLDARLAASTAARRSLQPIDGKLFEVVVEGPGIHVGLRARGPRLILEEPRDGEPDARLSATPLDALRLAQSQSLSNLKQTDARLEGNIHVAEAFARTLALLSPEAEAELAGWVGDIAAHEIVAAAHALKAFALEVGQTLERDTAEFLREERPVLARSREVEAFVEEVDDIRDAVERAASRLDALVRGPAGRPAGGRQRDSGSGGAPNSPGPGQPAAGD